jgi:hypothetical protein
LIVNACVDWVSGMQSEACSRAVTITQIFIVGSGRAAKVQAESQAVVKKPLAKRAASLDSQAACRRTRDIP